ncbi:MAG: PAS domain S-box protein [bacterium]
MDRFRLIVEQLPEALCVARGAKVLFMNPRAQQLLGVQQDKDICLEDFIQIQEDSGWSGLEESFQQAALKQHSLLRLLGRDGKLHWVRMQGVPITWEGEQAFLYCIIDMTRQRCLEEDLRASEERYRTAIEHASDGVAMVRGEQHIYVNQRFLDIFGYERPEEVVGKPISMVVHPEDRQRVMEMNLRRQKGEPVPSRYEVKGIRENGAPIYVEVSATRTSYRGEPVSLVYVRDITERKWMEEALQRSRDFYLTLFEEFPTMIWRLGVDGHCDYLNRAWLDFTGRTLQQDKGEGWLEVIHPEDLEGFKALLAKALSQQEPFCAELRARRRDGVWRWVLKIGKPFHGLNGEFSGYIGASFDITERKQQEEELRLNATLDPLTALPNRRLLEDRLKMALAQASRKNLSVGLILMDLDNFKEVNDKLGHLAGDELLVELGRRLCALVRGGDTVARLGGDEFVVVLPEIPRAREAYKVAKRILEAIRKPFCIHGQNLYMSSSLGVAIFPDHGGSPEVLLQRADQALYQAKARGGNQALIFHPSSEMARVPKHLGKPN